MILGYNKDYRWAIQAYSGSLGHHIVTKYCLAGTWSDWKTIAFTDSTVEGAKYMVTLFSDGSGWYTDKYRLYGQYDSVDGQTLELKTEGGYKVRTDIATKLATSRTIWGQSFDGTGNVSGDLYINAAKLVFNGDAANYFISCQGTSLATYNMFGGHSFCTVGGTQRMLISTSGNVTIGASDLATSNYKLYVDGVGVAFGTTDDCRIDFQRAGINKFRAVNAGGCFSWRVNGVDTDVMIINANGNVTIGNSDLARTSAKLYVDGDTKFTTDANNLKLYTRISQTSIQVGRTTANYTGGYNGGLMYGEDDTALGYIAGVFNDKSANDTRFFYGGPAGSAAMYIKNGNVLIGTTEDNRAKLQVAGDISMNGTSLTDKLTELEQRLVALGG